MRFCLDSWAVVQWLQGEEPAHARVAEIFPERPVMSWINLGEVFYVVQRRTDRQRALRIVNQLRRGLTLDLPSERRVIEAAGIKAVHPMSYADAFAVATALAHDATLLTGDPEIIEADAGWPVEDVR